MSVLTIVGAIVALLKFGSNLMGLLPSRDYKLGAAETQNAALEEELRREQKSVAAGDNRSGWLQPSADPNDLDK